MFPCIITLLLIAPPDDYAAVAAKRAAAAMAAAGQLDATKAERVRTAVAAHYTGLNAVHTARDAAAGDPVAREKAAAEVKELHAKFKAVLAAELTAVQTEAVMDQMTYNVVPNTLKAYREMLPTLTDAQAVRIRELLVVGREDALVAGASKAKHEKFGVAKGKINNYLSGQGYDLKKAGQEWAERRKAAEAKK
ncbi:DUF3826 domain-containing protein [Limnoglobus roseus]|uniref:DUF3826 domain-containing protein n=1 Tax=Limnoglobus roseus TaxID=2598579 RepID=A0A5C1AFB8_9BACT|nr:DUF3826 domain-containing protein [Limnoglobus roseus]QEL17951.1 hypothetical protein PX52LOC_04965 [Limnoglobus roseus]